MILFFLVGKNVGRGFQYRVGIAQDEIEDIGFDFNRLFTAMFPTVVPVPVPFVVVPIAAIVTVFRNHDYRRFVPVPITIAVAIAVTIPIAITVTISITVPAFTVHVSFFRHSSTLGSKLRVMEV